MPILTQAASEPRLTVLETLRRIIQEVNTAENIEQALALVVKRVKQVMQTDVCSIYLTATSTNENVLIATDGLNPDMVGKVRLAETEGLIGFVCQRAESLNVDNALNHAHFKFIPETGEEHYYGFIGVPIIHHRNVLGAIVVQQKQQRCFAEDELTLIVTIAAQLAGAIAHATASGGINGLDNEMPKDHAFRGLVGAPGVTLGTAVVIFPSAALEAVPSRQTDDIDGEIQAFLTALAATSNEITLIKKRVAHLPAENHAIFDAYLLMLKSNSLVEKTIARIRQGYWASAALRDTVQEQVHVFSKMEDSYLSERAQDIRDLGRRILVHLQSKTKGPRNYPEKVVLIGDELGVSDLMEVSHDKLTGVVCTHGSGSSHVAILARALGVPTVMGAKDLPTSQVDGLDVVVDGYRGCIYVKPSDAIRDEYQRLIQEEVELSADLEALRDLPAETPDKVKMPLYVNTGLLSDISSSINSGAEGIGLYRTEFPFMVRDQFPGEEEQTRLYRSVLESFAPRPVTLRTLDIGGDKNLSYFPIHEDNPFLGWRGIRVSLDHPDIFLVQLRAMLKASIGLNNLSILLPMISNVPEVNESLTLICRARDELISEGMTDVAMPKIGAMIEVPSAVYQASTIAKRVDFLSIGTNDLVQYLLAVDRNNANVAHLYDCLHPAVIMAVQHIIDIGALNHISVSICGEMAGDPAAALLLLGMGMHTGNLSMSVVAIPRVKWVIRNFSYIRARTLLEEVCQLEDAHSIRTLLNAELERAGLGGLLRPGK